MCYPKPGPRCSSHAAKILAQAKLAARNGDRNDWTLREAVDNAQLEYDATPAGIKELGRRITDQEGLFSQARRKDTSLLTEYQLRLKLGEAKRKERLDLIKASDNGDTAHTGTYSEQQFDSSFHRFARENEERPSRPMSKEILQKIILDSNNFTNKLDADEMEALAWFTSDGASTINKHLTGTSPNFYLHDRGEKETKREFSAREKIASKAHTEHLHETVNRLDSALEKGERDTPLKVYRGISHKTMVGFGFNNAEDYVEKTFKEGDTFTSPVFMSATLDYQTCERFQTSRVALEVLGKTVAPVANISAYSMNEREYVLPRNKSYKVKKVTSTDSGYGYNTYTVQLEEM